MKKPKHELGAFLRIPLADGSFGYGRLLEPPYVGFYNYRTTNPSADLEAIASKPVLFKLAVRRRVGLDKWETIGRRALEPEMAQPIVQYMQNVGDFRKCTIFDTAGMERNAEPDECVGLERAAVWESLGVEERLLDALIGRPNNEEIRSRVRLK